MEAVDSLQEPDEARPAKRVRLEAPLAVTEKTQDEMVDEDDWDDVYSGETMDAALKSADVAGEATLGGAPPNHNSANDSHGLNEDSATRSQDVVIADAQVEETGLPLDAISDGDELIAPQAAVESTDSSSQRVLQQTSDVVVEPVVQDSITEGQPGTTANGHVQQDGETSRREAENDEPVDGNNTADVQTTNPNRKPRDDPEFMAAAVAQKDEENAEWQFDPSDAESSEDSTSTDSDDDSDRSDSDSEGGYEMLDPATAAKMLMSGDDEDGEGEKGRSKTGADHQPRTTNEVKDTVIPKPDVSITPDMKITLLGTVERTVETMVLVKGATPGEYQVLESGSVLCNENREVIGAVAETLGRVQEPMYSVAFTSEKEIEEAGLEFGTTIFYVDGHSTFVFTQPLRNLKGTDASNIHDEEVGEDEMEFSDDEAEAEYKRLRKLNKKAGRGDLSRGAFSERAKAATTSRQDGGSDNINHDDAPAGDYGTNLSYDDTDQPLEEFYQPLKRPDNLSSLMAGGHPLPKPPYSSSDRGRGRGRGDFRGRGRNDRGRGRGGFDRGGYHGGGGGRSSQNQQAHNGQRGNAHSFPDRHNHATNGSRHDRKQHTLPPRPQGNSAPSPPAPQLPPQPQYSQQALPNYQFNGYTFQYGNQPPVPAQFGGYNPPPQQTYQTPISAIPPGAYVNPAFYPQHGQTPQQPQAGWSVNPQMQQSQQYSAPNTASGQTQSGYQQHLQSIDLGDILKRLSNDPRK